MKTALQISALSVLITQAPAAISIVTQLNDNGSSVNDPTLAYASVEVSIGDVIVVANSVNKSTSIITFTLGVSSADTAAVTGNITFSASEQHAAHISYATVTAAGTLDLVLNPATTNTYTANTSLYVLRADPGETIQLAGTTTVADTGTPTTTSLSYTFANPITAGDAVAIEALTTESGVVTSDTDYTFTNSGGPGGITRRNTASSTAVSGSSWTANHTLAPTEDDFAGAGAVFQAIPVPEPSSALMLIATLSVSTLRRRR